MTVVVRFGNDEVWNFSSTPAITDDEFEDAVQRLGERIDKVQMLIFEGCSKITDRSFDLIQSKFYYLYELDLSGTKVTDRVFQSMNYIWLTPKVSFNNCYGITPRGKEFIPEGWEMNNCGLRLKLTQKTRQWDMSIDAQDVLECALECRTPEIRDGYKECRYPVGYPLEGVGRLHYYAEVDSAKVDTYFPGAQSNVQQALSMPTSEMRQEPSDGDVKKDTPAATAVSEKCQDAAPKRPATEPLADEWEFNTDSDDGLSRCGSYRWKWPVDAKGGGGGFALAGSDTD